MLKEAIQTKLKESMKAKDQVSLDCVRMVIAAIKNREIEKRGELTDDECLKVLTTISKQRIESIEMFRQGGRVDLAEREEKELALIRSFMPEQLSDADLARLVDDAIAEVGAKAPNDMGKVMKALAPKVQGRADGKVVSDLVRNRLSKN